MIRIISILLGLLLSLTLSSQIITTHGDSVFLKEVSNSDTVLSDELYELINKYLEDSIQCKHLKYFVLGSYNYEFDSTFFIRQLDNTFFFLNKLINTPDKKDEIPTYNPDYEYYFMKIKDFIIVGQREEFKNVFNKNMLIFRSKFNSFVIIRKFSCYKRGIIKKTESRFQMTLKIDSTTKSIRVLRFLSYH